VVVAAMDATAIGATVVVAATDEHSKEGRS